ncbi:hypothetical protein [Paenibacillus soyae]|uniref:Uncharacterized protein n=1 Tax=Paenibacillus soyae TaxID=2969249 RepID=A0A9X2N1R3_9BACL|nr:hypothetical protein [Paenibacillus soyae]MCR2807447.1 hypothetical protein [Paenibacillus soyae]
MNLLYSLAFVALAVASVAFQAADAIRRKQFKVLAAQGAILALAIVLGILAIYNFRIPSMAELLQALVPWQA